MIDNPWMWLLFVAASIVVLTLGSALVAGVITSFREQKPCEKCGHVPTDETKVEK